MNCVSMYCLVLYKFIVYDIDMHIGNTEPRRLPNNKQVHVIVIILSYQDRFKKIFFEMLPEVP